MAERYPAAFADWSKLGFQKSQHRPSNAVTRGIGQYFKGFCEVIPKILKGICIKGWIIE